MAAPLVNSREWWEQYFESGWAANDGPARTRYCMQVLIDHLPAAERKFLRDGAREILDWGCAFGEGVDALARAFPSCRVSGTDFAAHAVAEARRRFPDREFIQAEPTGTERVFDLVVTLNRLQHFPNPLEVLQKLLRNCRHMCMALVPYNEQPPRAGHCAQFRDESFPERAGDFRRVHMSVLDTDPKYGHSQQLLVIYGSAPYAALRAEREQRGREQDKWNEIYRGHAPQDSAAVQRFNTEFAALVKELLPEGGAVLEAGCGEGWQSLALAALGPYAVHLLDFSDEALKCARQVFAQAGAAGTFHSGDVYEPGLPEYDLVFNAGVLEHYSFDEQVRFVKGMASRSRRFVLVLVPNRLCYWYWLWRVQMQAAGDWPYGKESPLADLSAVFEAAGLRYLGQHFTGESWTETFIEQAAGLDADARRRVLEIHRSPVLPAASKGYLLAALGSVSPGKERVPARWQRPLWREPTSAAEFHSAVGDALALRIGAERQAERLRGQLADRVRELHDLRLQVQQGQQRLAALDAQLAELRGWNETLTRRLSEREELVESLNRRLAEMQTWAESARLEAQRREGVIEELREHSRRLEEAKEHLRDAAQERADTIARLGEAKEYFQKTIREQADALAACEESRRSLQAGQAEHLARLRALEQSSQAQIETLGRALAAEQAKLAELAAWLERLRQRWWWRLLRGSARLVGGGGAFRTPEP